MLDYRKFLNRYIDGEEIDESSTLTYYGIIDLLFYIYNDDIVPRENLVIELREEIRQKDILILKLKRQGY